MATNYRQAISRAFDATNDVLKVILQAGTAVLGKVRLVDSGGTEVTETTNHSVKSTLQAGTNVAGKIRLVTATGDEITDDTADAVKALLKTPAGDSPIDDTLDAVQTKERESIVETPFTGTGNLVVGTNKIAPGAAFELEEVDLHLSAAPTTGTQNLVITRDDGNGSAYDRVILTIDLVVNAVTDLSVKPAMKCKSTDVITVAWTNTDGRTYGLEFKHKLL